MPSDLDISDGEAVALYESALNATVKRNVRGKATKVSQIHVDNVSGGTTAAFLELFNHPNPTLTSTFPNVVVPCTASAHMLISIVGEDPGILFSSGLSMALVDAVHGSSLTGSDRKSFQVFKDE